MAKMTMAKAIAVEKFVGQKGDFITFADGDGLIKLAFDGHVDVPMLEAVSLEAEVRGRSFGQNQSLSVTSHTIRRLTAVSK